MSDEPIDIRLPGLGQGVSEALIVEWLAGVGDHVDRGDVVALIETDKASTEIVAERGGRIAAHSVPARTIVKPGDVLYQLNVDATTDRETQMDDIERRIADVMLTKLRIREPSLTYADLSRPLDDLDFDSLDVVELTQMLEQELKVKADLDVTAGFVQLQDFSSYFVTLAGQG